MYPPLWGDTFCFALFLTALSLSLNPLSGLGFPIIPVVVVVVVVVRVYLVHYSRYLDETW